MFLPIALKPHIMNLQVELSHGIKGSILAINLQQGFVLSEGGTILASYDTHNNLIAFNKPLLGSLAGLQLRHIKQVLFKSNRIDATKNITLVPTDSFSVDYYKP